MKINDIITEAVKQRLDAKCWKGKHKEGTKIKGGIRVNNCVPNEAVDRNAEPQPSGVYKKNEFDINTKEQQWMQSMKKKHPDVTFAQNKTTMQIFAMVPEKGKVGTFDPRQQVTELEVTDLVKPNAQTNTPPRRVYSIALDGRPGKPGGDKFNAVDAWNALAMVFPQDYPGEAAQQKIAEVQKRGSAIVKTGITSEDIAETYVSKLSGFVPEQFWRIIGGGLNEELEEEFDLIESIVEDIAEHNGVDAEIVWEDLESLTDDELYVFATTTPVTEDWQKVNKKDKTDGMSKKAVKAYRREHPGSKLKTAVTTKPSKLKKGSKASKRRKSYCSRSKGQMKMHNISCAKTPDKAICKARRRWNC